MRKKIIMLCILSVATIITIYLCSSKRAIEADIYSGKTLTIGIVGDIPEVSEDNVNFIELQLSDIENQSITNEYDAIIISKDFFSDAAKPEYASIYKKSKIPFFFIENQKCYTPFIDEKLSYEEAPVIDRSSYASGFLCENDTLLFWRYGLYNDVQNSLNIRNVYTRIFRTIAGLKVEI